MMQVNHKFWPLFRGVQANEAAVQSEVNETGCTPDEAVSKLSNENKLALNPAAQRLWQEHLAKNPSQRHTAGFVAWAETYLAQEAQREETTLEMEFPHMIGKPIEALRAEKARHELIDEICDLLVSKDGTGCGGKYSTFNIAAVRKQMLEGRDWTIQKLTARKDEIVREQMLSAKPIAELKAMVKEHYNQPIAFPGYPALPDRTYVRGQGWVTVNAEYLEQLIREDVFSFRRLVKLYGSSQVDNRRGLR